MNLSESLEKFSHALKHRNPYYACDELAELDSAIRRHISLHARDRRLEVQTLLRIRDEIEKNLDRKLSHDEATQHIAKLMIKEITDIRDGLLN